MNTYFIGCLHLGHQAIAKYRGFADSVEHDEYLIEQWNKTVVNKKDIIYILGDITLEKNFWYFQLDRLRGVKHVLLGNHDRKQDVLELLKYVDSVAGMIDYKGGVLTHAPIHPSEIGGYRFNIHAHTHHENKLAEVEALSRYNDEGSIMQPTLHKYLCVDAKVIDFKPKTLEQLLNK